MTTFKQALLRETRVALSLRAQPLWFRILKWIAIIAYIAAFHDRAWFWLVLAGCFAAALAVHFLYRWKTRTWTRPWGGWNDLAAGRSE